MFFLGAGEVDLKVGFSAADFVTAYKVRRGCSPSPEGLASFCYFLLVAAAYRCGATRWLGTCRLQLPCEGCRAVAIVQQAGTCRSPVAFCHALPHPLPNCQPMVMDITYDEGDESASETSSMAG